MANWQRVLDIKDDWENEEITVAELARRIAAKLTALQPFDDEVIEDQREEIAYEFGYLARQEDCTNDEFDNILEMLYDWADTSLDDNWNGKKVCWVKTTF